MSFGLNDKTWVDPDDEREVICDYCVSFEPCPCGCGEGWCETFKQFVDGDEFADCGEGNFVI